MDREASKKVRHLIAGGINTVFGLATYPIIYLVAEPFGIGYIKTLLMASIISISFSFLTSKYYVFQSKGNVKKEYAKFFSFYGFYLSINLIFLPLLVEVVNLTPIVAQTLFSVFIIVTSYFWHNHVTFKSVKENR